MSVLRIETERELKLALERERDRLRANALWLNRGEQALAQSEHDESSSGGNEADVASDVVEQTLEVSLERDEYKRLAEVEAALQRVTDGHYGVCEKCRQMIAPARLVALPWARRCIACSGR